MPVIILRSITSVRKL